MKLLQMLMLNPKVAIIDEINSGLRLKWQRLAFMKLC